MNKKLKIVLFVVVGALVMVLAGLAFVGIGALSQPQQQKAQPVQVVDPKDPQTAPDKEERQQAVDDFAATAERKVVENSYGGKDIYYTLTNNSDYEFSFVTVSVKGTDSSGVTIETGDGVANNVMPGETVQIEVLFLELESISVLADPQVEVSFADL